MESMQHATKIAKLKRERNHLMKRLYNRQLPYPMMPDEKSKLKKALKKVTKEINDTRALWGYELARQVTMFENFNQCEIDNHKNQ